MIRIVYRWRVAPEKFDEFQDTWRATTNHIHETVPGALGSFMLRSQGDDTEVLTIARWDSLAAWEAFFKGDNPAQMTRMRELGTRLSVEAFDEIEDHTR